MDVSVIIVNYNTFQLTQNCIDSIFQKTNGIEFEIILVDNASQDKSIEVFSTDKRVHYYYLQENIGFGKANNYGIRKAKGKYIFCLNSDTLLCNNAIKYFFDFCEGFSENIGAVGCILINDKGHEIHSFASFPKCRSLLYARILSPFYTLLGKQYNTLDNPKYRQGHSFHVDYVTGADMFVKKDLLDKYGAFDPDFFMYYEETELQYRLTQKGYGSYIIDTPKIIHLEGQSVKPKKQKGLSNKLIFNQVSQFLYLKKTHKIYQYILYRLCFFFIRIPFLLNPDLSFQDKVRYLLILTSNKNK